jgi:hypothetical protein
MDYQLARRLLTKSQISSFADANLDFSQTVLDAYAEKENWREFAHLRKTSDGKSTFLFPGKGDIFE